MFTKFSRRHRNLVRTAQHLHLRSLIDWSVTVFADEDAASRRSLQSRVRESHIHSAWIKTRQDRLNLTGDDLWSESAGLNRHIVGDGRALVRRLNR